MEKINCMLTLPYPSMDGIEKDVRLGMLLYEAYTGKIGALSAVSDYVYQCITNKEISPAISDLFECFALTKMKHFKIIGEMMLKLGVDPQIKAQTKSFRNKSSENTLNLLIEQIKNNIRIEQASIDYYKKIIIHTHNKTVICILNRFILDNDHHISILNQIIEEL